MSVPILHPSPLAGVPPALLASLGERIAAVALPLQREQGLSPAGHKALSDLEQLGLELQALVHAMGTTAWQAAESVPLLDAAQAARRQWLPELQRRGLGLEVVGDPAQVQIEPAQLQHGLDLLISHGLAGGQSLLLRVLPALTPSQGAVYELGGAGAGPDPAELHGQLLQWLARAHGWRIERPARTPGGGWQLRLQVGEPQGDIDPVGLPRRHWAADARVLVVEPDDRTREQAGDLLRRAGLRADCVTGPEKVAAALQDGDPRAIVSGLPLDDPRARDVFEPLRQRLPGLRWVELVDQPYVFAAGSLDGQIPARLSRSDLAHTLLASLAE